MNNDLISRETALSIVERNAFHEGREWVFRGRIMRELEEAPAVDAEPARHGRWYKPKGMMPPEHHHRHRCSECYCLAPYERPGREWLSDYCPNCGAKMENLDYPPST